MVEAALIIITVE